jgi:16S rRNA (guanine966-N2)-methyltransferase
MRIVGGSLRGRPIAAPPDQRTRPTSDRVREAMFNVLAHGVEGFTLEGVRVLDLFAGTGALGLEALSRGAAFCLFVEAEPEARGLIRQNVEALGLSGVTKIFRRDATALGPAGKYGGFGLALLDPPYGRGMGEQALASAAEGGWLAPAALVMLEEAKDAHIALPAGFIAFDRRTWSDTQAVLARWSGVPAGGGDIRTRTADGG